MTTYEVATYDPSPTGPMKALGVRRYTHRWRFRAWLAAELECWRREWVQPGWYHTITKLK
jgi:hypothetical protein